MWSDDGRCPQPADPNLPTPPGLPLASPMRGTCVRAASMCMRVVVRRPCVVGHRRYHNSHVQRALSQRRWVLLRLSPAGLGVSDVWFPGEEHVLRTAQYILLRDCLCQRTRTFSVRTLQCG